MALRRDAEPLGFAGGGRDLADGGDRADHLLLRGFRELLGHFESPQVIGRDEGDEGLAQFMHLEHQAPDRDISLYVNSPGGTFHAMAAIYDTMQYVSCDVETICPGRTGAASSVLLAGGAPGKRFAPPDARLVIHQPALPAPVRGQASDLAIQADELTRVRLRTEELLARHTGRSREQIGRDIEREKILTAQEAVEYGLVDGISPHRRATPVPPTGR